MLYLIKHILFILLVIFTCTAFAEYNNSNPIRHFDTSKKVVVLSFDDGPSVPYTSQILDILAKQNVKATFFVMGVNAKQHPELMHKIIKQGHEIGNHSTYHNKLNRKSVEAIIKDLSYTDKIIRGYGYNKEITFRAPFGLTSNNVTTALTEMNKRHILFEFLPQDWTKISADEITRHVTSRLRPGLIITLHDGGKNRQNTVIATEQIIEILKSKGYKFLTVSEMFEQKSID